VVECLFGKHEASSNPSPAKQKQTHTHNPSEQCLGDNKDSADTGYCFHIIYTLQMRNLTNSLFRGYYVASMYWGRTRSPGWVAARGAHSLSHLISHLTLLFWGCVCIHYRVVLWGELELCPQLGSRYFWQPLNRGF
jgi:hypothetical protein